MNTKMLFAIFAVTVTSIIVVSQFDRVSQTEPVTDTQLPTDNNQNIQEVSETAKDLEIFSSAEYDFSFEYSRDFKVEERAPGFFVLSLVSENVPQAGISIDARMRGAFQSFEGAVEDTTENYTVVSTEKVNGWSMFDVVGKEGMVNGVAFKLAFHPYKTGVIAVQTIDAEPYGDVFGDIVRSFKW